MLTAIVAFTHDPIEYLTILIDQTSLIAHRPSLPSAVLCSVMSVSHSWFGPFAVNVMHGRPGHPIPALTGGDR